MSLHFILSVNGNRLGTVNIRRQDPLDLTDPEAIADEVCTYDVSLDYQPIGTVDHRYGDGAWALVAVAADLIAEDIAHKAEFTRGDA